MIHYLLFPSCGAALVAVITVDGPLVMLVVIVVDVLVVVIVGAGSVVLTPEDDPAHLPALGTRKLTLVMPTDLGCCPGVGPGLVTPALVVALLVYVCTTFPSSSFTVTT